MVNGPASRRCVRRREIVAADIDAVADLLRRGFPGRSHGYWMRGLGRMAERAGVPAGCPRFGFLFESEGRPVGVLLMLFRADGDRILCNLSSWYVEPAYRMHAPLLIVSMLARRDVTFTNLSAAPGTWATIEAQGFRALPNRAAVVPARIARSAGEPPIHCPAAGGFAELPEASLLDDHLGYGCIMLIIAAPDGPQPFAFLPIRIWSGRLPLPLAQLVYCRDIADYRRFAGGIGRSLLRRGVLGVLVAGHDAPPGFAVPRRRVYVRGPHPPRTGDLAYTERAIFGS